MELAYADDDYSDLEDELLNDMGSSLKLPEATVGQIKAHVKTEYYKRQRIMSSSAGLLAALVILFIFVMTATFLRSVFFGLILAYFFLPLQRWYERQVFSRTLVHRLLAIPQAGAAPLRGSIRAVRNLFSASPSLTPTPASQALPAREQLAWMNRSCHATVLTFVLILLAVGSIIF